MAVFTIYVEKYLLRMNVFYMTPLCWNVVVNIQTELLFYLTNDKEEINCFLYAVKNPS